MNAKEYLNQIKVSNIKVKQLEEELDELRQRTMSTGSIDYGERVQTSKTNDAMAKYMVKCEELEKQLIEAREYNLSVRDLVVKQIHQLDNPVYINVLYKRYVNGYRLERIALDEDYSYGYTRRLCFKAVRCFANMFDMDDKTKSGNK